MVIGANQVVRPSLGSRVRAVGRVRAALIKWCVLGAERSVDFIRGHVQETECLLLRGGEFRPVSPCFFNQAEGPINVSTDEIIRTADRAVDVAFRCEMNDCSRRGLLQERTKALAVTYVSLVKRIERLADEAAQIFRISGVSKLIEVNERRFFFSNPLQGEVRSDEARAASNQNGGLHVGSAYDCK